MIDNCAAKRAGRVAGRADEAPPRDLSRWPPRAQGYFWDGYLEGRRLRDAAACSCSGTQTPRRPFNGTTLGREAAE